MAETNLPHIFLDASAVGHTYKSPNQGGGNSLSLVPRNRIPHAEHVRKLLDDAWRENLKNSDNRKSVSLPTRNGVYLEFTGAPAADLKTQSLDIRRNGIRLLNVATQKGEDGREITRATVFVPAGKEKIFLKKVEDYEKKDTPPNKNGEPGKPKNRDLVESIEEIRNAVLESFWQDPLHLIPEDDNPDWCEVWLRTDQDAESTARNFLILCENLNIETKQGQLAFPERCVVLVKSGRTQLNEIIAAEDFLAEFRLAKETAGYWIELENREQAEWVDNLAPIIHQAPLMSNWHG